MKKIIFSIVVMASVLGSCNQNSTDNKNNHSNHLSNDNMMNNDSTMTRNKSNTMDHHEKMYACSMHPEVIGKKDEKCSKCGMKLTEPVLVKKEESK